MGLYESLDKLQQKPESTKRKILIVLILISFVLLAGLWATNLRKRIAGDTLLAPNTNETEDKSSAAQVAGPLTSLKDGFLLIISDVRQKTSEFFAQTEEILKDQDLPEAIESETEPEARKIYKLPATE